MENWRIERVSTGEHVVEKMTKYMTHPIGFIILSTDYNFKTELYGHIVNSLEDISVCWERNTEMSLRMAQFPLRQGKNALLVMTEWGTKHHTERHKAVTRLREFGAKTVIGIYDPTERLCQPITADGFDLLLSPISLT